MILKIKKGNLVIASSILLIISALFILFIAPKAYADDVGTINRSFGVELWIGNNAPIIVFDPGTSYTLAGTDPQTGSQVLVWFVFNVTDTNGEDDIVENTARFNLTLGTPGFSQFRYNSSCINVSKLIGYQRVVFNCSVWMKYYDNASANWVLNATAFDVAGSQAINDSETFTYNQLSGMSIPRALINFSGPSLGDSNYPTGGTNITLNNTGNDDFDEINISAAHLYGADDRDYYIGVGNFSANFSNAMDTGGVSLNDTGITFIKDGSNLLLTHGHTSAKTDYNDGVIPDKGNQSLFFWADVPSTGLIAQKYNNTWNITVVDK